MPKFTLNKDHPDVDLFEPAGGLDSITVKSGDAIDVPGELVTSRPEPKDDEPAPEPLPEDAYIVVNNGVESAWPKAVWDLVADKKPVAAKTKEN